MLYSLRKFVVKIKNKLNENSFQNLLWLINIGPSIGGFSYFNDKIKAPFWIVYFLSNIYVNVIGAVLYQIYYADGLIDTLYSYFNISMSIIIHSMGNWLVFERKRLKNIFVLVKNNNDMAIQCEHNLEKLKDLLKPIKQLVIVWYLFHFINDFLIFAILRLFKMDKFGLAPCIGLEFLNNIPNKEICILLLGSNSITAEIAVVGYDATFLFLLAHTAAMFEILKEETLSLNNIGYSEGQEEAAAIVRKKLKDLSNCHNLLLQTWEKIQEIYSVNISVSFGLEAITICLFFVLPLDVCFRFGPFILHGIALFFLYCYQGQKVTTAAERFQEALYCSGWENFRIDNQKMISFMLRQSQKPVTLLVASFVPVSIYTFACTMQFIYKFVTVFKT
ncbi:odorant receptor 85c-like [Battus philenor]|uniref:odorant receptor 85c-like n=1 Tax=Battus philenor TaxID=42288 RepID=UPI0035CF56ED